MVIHVALLTAVQEHDDGAVTTTVPVIVSTALPAAALNKLGLAELAHVCASAAAQERRNNAIVRSIS
jgi:hypothetical protein